jgi:hypothetical protein
MGSKALFLIQTERVGIAGPYFLPSSDHEIFVGTEERVGDPIHLSIFVVIIRSVGSRAGRYDQLV